MQKEDLKKKFGLDVDSYVKLKNNVYLLRLENKEEVILKTRRVVDKNFMDDHRFDNEVRMYNYVSDLKLKHLHVPRILSEKKSKTSEILLEFIPKSDEREINVREFVNAYFELQLLSVPRKFTIDFINQYAIGFFYKIVIVSLVTLREKIGLATCLQIVLFYLKLTLSCKRLNKSYWLHGDLNNKNFFYNKKNKLLYFIDFEIMFYTNKWVLTEVIAKCFSYKEEEEKLNFSLEFLKEYLEKAQFAIEDFEKIDLKQQFRFSILQRSVQAIAHTKIEAKRQAFINMLKMCIDDISFEAWYGVHVEPSLRASTKKLMAS